jgi:nitroimidazol reductase NimA-like FMN-containing flavoprotein (pyridoxamine 5'-phosphate oxidase superfamily)
MTMAPHAQPVFRELSERDARRILKANHIGRMAFSFQDRVDIRPVHYVSAAGWIFGRTSPGEKLVTLQHNRWVAFEVDEVTGPFDWVSVIAKGTFYQLAPEGSAHDIALYKRALGHLRKLMPDALKPADPVSFRTEVFGIFIDSLTGRSCSTR